MAQGVVSDSHEVARPVSALRLLRVSRGWTQGELAAAAGLARPTISRLENEHEEPQYSTARRLAEALGFPVEVIFPPLNERGPATTGPLATTTPATGPPDVLVEG